VRLSSPAAISAAAYCKDNVMRSIQSSVTPRQPGRKFPPYGSNATILTLLLTLGACFSAAAAAESPAAVARSVVVQGTPAEVWAMIGSFCAIENWLPPVGTCTEDGKTPPTRTLVTRDGSATFVERETARSDSENFYSYVFVSSPLPVTRYSATIRVAANGQNGSTVTWNGTYTPDAGKGDEAAAALDGIYKSGLESIQQLAEQQLAPSAPNRATP
jgi:Polyketide cyclase / dehydrase and lipid transport